MTKQPPLMLALNVSDSAEDGPDVAVVAVTADQLRRWMAEIDRVRLLKLGTEGGDWADSRMYGVMYWDNNPYWLKGGELAEELEKEVDGGGWVKLTPEQASRDRLEAAERESDAQADAVRRFVTAERVQWRAYPKWGTGQYETAELSRADIVSLLTEVDPPVATDQPPMLPLPDGELRVFEADESQGDLGRIYVLDVLGSACSSASAPTASTSTSTATPPASRSARRCWWRSTTAAKPSTRSDGREPP